MTNGSITDRYTLYTLIVRVLHALYWKVGRENKRKQIGILQHIALRIVSVSAMLVSIHQKNIAQAFILERYFFVSIYPAVIPGTYLMVFLVAALLLCLLHQIYIQRS